MVYKFEIPKGMKLAIEDWNVIQNAKDLEAFIQKKGLKLGKIKKSERILFYKKENPAYEKIGTEDFLSLVKAHKCYVAYDGDGFAKIFAFRNIE